MKLCAQKGNSMNPVLQNFSLQAGGSHYPSVNPKLQEAFANLILNKCTQLAEQEEDRYLEMGETDLAYAMANYRALIKQHFGVDNGRKASN